MYMNVLIVDDEPGLRSGLSKFLSFRGYRVLEASKAEEARAAVCRKEVHIALLDLKLGQDNGMDLLREWRREEPGLPVIIITGHGDVASAVECMKSGASNYIQKPIDHDLLISILEKERHSLGERLAAEGFRESLAYSAGIRMARSLHPEMEKVESIVEKVKDSDVPVLILGETGTGKEVVARTIHYSGVYRDRPFIGLNCASLNENLLESELFGHEKGAFSGAVSRKPGRFELAGNGTLFLDEIGDMSPGMQGKVLRVLQEKTMERVGGVRPVSVYCRLVTATNKDMRLLREAGGFREDLYYRISIVSLTLPPLRERGRDIPVLAKLFIDEANANYGRSVKRISPRIMKRLLSYPWPGNIRQLKNVIANAVILSDGGEIEDVELPDGKGGGAEDAALEGTLAQTIAKRASEMEKSIIRSCLERNGRNISRTAAELGVSRKTLYEKKHRYSL